MLCALPSPIATLPRVTWFSFFQASSPNNSTTSLLRTARSRSSPAPPCGVPAPGGTPLLPPSPLPVLTPHDSDGERESAGCLPAIDPPTSRSPATMLSSKGRAVGPSVGDDGLEGTPAGRWPPIPPPTPKPPNPPAVPSPVRGCCGEGSAGWRAATVLCSSRPPRKTGFLMLSSRTRSLTPCLSAGSACCAGVSKKNPLPKLCLDSNSCSREMEFESRQSLGRSEEHTSEL